MAVIRCSKGHYYDDKHYQDCPFCGVDLPEIEHRSKIDNSDSDERLTEALKKDFRSDDQVTVKFSQDGDPKTIGLYAGSVRNNPVVGWLVCVLGPERGRDYRLHAGRNFIGRSGRMDISVMEDSSITRENHASIVYDPKSNQFFLIPGNSTQISYKDQAVIEPLPLNDQDIFSLGMSEFRFVAYCKGDVQWSE